MLFNEPKLLKFERRNQRPDARLRVSVLFNEPKLLKFVTADDDQQLNEQRFSALQRAEIAEIDALFCRALARRWFQCSSTSRNC